MRAVLVVVREVFSEDLLEVVPPEDEEPIQAFSANGPEEALRKRVRSRRSNRRLYGDRVPIQSSLEKPAQSSEHRSIRRLQGRTHHLVAQNGDPVAEHNASRASSRWPPRERRINWEETDEGHVKEGERHAPSSSPISSDESPG